ncbi:MAG: hypothetical protein JW959_14985 [Pirellulales bacterium]|nr:hypothetical protein [Pirellulales bacterium]
MGRTMLGIIVGLGLVVAAAAEPRGEYQPSAVPALRTPAATAGTELIVVSTPVGDNVLMLTVVDPRRKAMSVYHIETATGKITLKSVRDIQWDLQITDLNNENPLPQEIRSLLEQR